MVWKNDSNASGFQSYAFEKTGAILLACMEWNTGANEYIWVFPKMAVPQNGWL